MFRPPAVQTVSQWADKNRYLVSESSAEPGIWRTDRAPYQREIMDSFTQPGVWQIVIMASAQVGKSEIELNMMGCAIDNDPGPMLYIQPTDKVGDIFDPDGMTLALIYSNGMHAPTGNYTISPSGPLKEMDDHVTISYTEAGKTVSVDISINVISAHVFGVVWDYSNPNTALT